MECGPGVFEPAGDARGHATGVDQGRQRSTRDMAVAAVGVV